MGARRGGRESALQMLFQIDAQDGFSAVDTSADAPRRVDGADAEPTIALFFRHFEADPEGKGYAETIVRGVCTERAAIDARIERASNNWRIARMSRVDRNLLRLATWELTYGDDQPRAVILDEAVELAKQFGSADSSSFVNGVLQRVADMLDKERARS